MVGGEKKRQANIKANVPCFVENNCESLVLGSNVDWIAFANTDACPGTDALVAPGSNLDKCKELCKMRKFGGFVTWQGHACFRAQKPDELIKARGHAHGGVWLFIPSAPLRRLPVEQLVQEFPEAQVPGGALPVPKRSGLSEDEMTEMFARSQPVVLQDAQRGWKARDLWTWDWFAVNYGEVETVCSDLAPFFPDIDRGVMQTVKVPLAEYVRYVKGEPNAIQQLQRSLTQVFYANTWTPFNEFLDFNSMINDRLYCVRDTYPRDTDKALYNCRTLTKVFFGPAGTISRLHHDTFASHVWLSQIRGRKQFICYHPDDTKFLHSTPPDDCGGRRSEFDPTNPDFDRFPEARSARAFSVVVEEGETVVLPSKWWHWAKSLTPSITLMRNFVNEVNQDEYLMWYKASNERKTAKQVCKG